MMIFIIHCDVEREILQARNDKKERKEENLKTTEEKKKKP